MKTSEHEYRLLPYYFDQGDYVPAYHMLLYRGKERDKIHAIKVRSDIVIPKLWHPAVQELLPKEILKTDGREVFAYPVSNTGNVEQYATGYLGIYDGKVVGIRTVDPRLLLPPSEYYRPEDYYTTWLEQRRIVYTLVDYDDEELILSMRTGLRRHADYWEKKET